MFRFFIKSEKDTERDRARVEIIFKNTISTKDGIRILERNGIYRAYTKGYRRRYQTWVVLRRHYVSFSGDYAVYYRYYNDGDNYYELTDPDNGNFTPFDEMDDGVPKKQALKVHCMLHCPCYDYTFALNLAVTYVLREIMISRSSACTDSKIYNPLTGRLVLKSGRAGQQSIHLLYKKVHF